MTALDSMMGILPVVLVAGVATKMTSSLFGNQEPSRQRSPRRSRPRRRSRPSRPGSIPGMSFGNFSNVKF